MYNKLFTKILDSSIWLAPDPHRLVWVTLLAVMDEDGNAFFACADNLAARARVTIEQAESAINAFESPDPKSGDPENEGRRIERFPGGWHVINAYKYRAIVTKAIQREKTRERVSDWRAKQKDVTKCNELLQSSNAKVTPSEAVSESDPIKRGRFTPPSVEEISIFFTEKGYQDETDKFFNFYAAKDWMMGKNKMKSWTHAAGGWIARLDKPPKKIDKSLAPELRDQKWM